MYESTETITHTTTTKSHWMEPDPPGEKAVPFCKPKTPSHVSTRKPKAHGPVSPITRAQFPRPANPTNHPPSRASSAAPATFATTPTACTPSPVRGPPISMAEFEAGSWDGGQFSSIAMAHATSPRSSTRSDVHISLAEFQGGCWDGGDLASPSSSFSNVTASPVYFIPHPTCLIPPVFLPGENRDYYVVIVGQEPGIFGHW